MNNSHLSPLTYSLKLALYNQKEQLKKTLKRMGYSARDTAMEPLVRGAHLLGFPERTKFRLMSTTRGKAVIRVPLRSIQKFVPNERLRDKFAMEYVNVLGEWDFFWDGDWDRQVLSIDPYYAEHSISYRSMLQRLEDGIHFRECDEFIAKSEQLQKEGRANRGNTVRELEVYFENLDRLYENIKKHGYKTQKELKGKPDDEIGVFVGRDGSLIKPVDKFHGTHRFAIARYLELETVPVCIRAVHSEWAKDHYDLLLNGGEKLETHFRG